MTEPHGNDHVGELITFEASLAILDEVASRGRRLPTLELPVRDALGHILAGPAVSQVDLPPFDKSAMDGYAVRGDDHRDVYEVIEEVPAGRTPSLPLSLGQATRVMTGAPVPAGTAAVIPWESTDNGRETVHVHRHPSKSNLCEKGEDVKTGQTIFQPGRRIDPVVAANMIACGLTEVTVYRRPRIAILTTGDEIVATPDQLAPGKIIDTNGPMLEMLARMHQLDVPLCESVVDEPKRSAAALQRAIDASDLVVVTGGVSAGDYDFVAGAIRACGYTIRFDNVSVQPGKPLTLAERDGAVILGLPGNPVSVLNGFHLCVLRVLAHWTNQPIQPRTFQAPLARTYKRRLGQRMAFVPCRIDAGGRLEPVTYHGSAHLLAISETDGVMLVPLNETEIPAGTMVRFFPRMS